MPKGRTPEAEEPRSERFMIRLTPGELENIAQVAPGPQPGTINPIEARRFLNTVAGALADLKAGEITLDHAMEVFQNYASGISSKQDNDTPGGSD